MLNSWMVYASQVFASRRWLMLSSWKFLTLAATGVTEVKWYAVTIGTSRWRIVVICFEYLR